MKTILLQQFADPESIPKIDLTYVPITNRRQPPGIGSNARKALKYYVLTKKKESPKILELEDSKTDQELQKDYKKLIGGNRKRKKTEGRKNSALEKEVKIALSAQGQNQPVVKKRSKKKADNKIANKNSNMSTFLLN